MSKKSFSFRGMFGVRKEPVPFPRDDESVTSASDCSGFGASETKGKQTAVKGNPDELDLVFIIDNTGSMGSWIRNVQENIQKIIHDIVVAESCNVRFALVSYRDHPPQDVSFVTKKHDFTSKVEKIQKWVDLMKAQGGGDMPEAVADGLNDALHLSYRPNSTKVAVLVADAPPHGLGGCSDGFPDGCPLGHDPLKIVRQMGEKGITIYTVICGNFPGQAFYQGIAQMTGGQHVPLSKAHLLSGAIVGAAQEEIVLDRLMQEVQEVSEAEERSTGRQLGEDELAAKLEEMFKKKGTVARQTRFSGEELPDYDKSAACYGKAASLAEVRATPGNEHLALGSHGEGFGSASFLPAGRFVSASLAGITSDFAAVSSFQCKRMARKSRVRKFG